MTVPQETVLASRHGVAAPPIAGAQDSAGTDQVCKSKSAYSTSSRVFDTISPLGDMT